MRTHAIAGTRARCREFRSTAYRLALQALNPSAVRKPLAPVRSQPRKEPTAGDRPGAPAAPVISDSTIIMRSLPRYSLQEQFFFADSQLFCRLCQEELSANSPTPKLHILASGRISHLNHGAREIVLDTLALLERRGYDTGEIIRIYAHVLCN